MAQFLELSRVQILALAIFARRKKQRENRTTEITTNSANLRVVEEESEEQWSYCPPAPSAYRNKITEIALYNLNP